MNPLLGTARITVCLETRDPLILVRVWGRHMIAALERGVCWVLA